MCAGLYTIIWNESRREISNCPPGYWNFNPDIVVEWRQRSVISWYVGLGCVLRKSKLSPGSWDTSFQSAAVVCCHLRILCFCTEKLVSLVVGTLHGTAITVWFILWYTHDLNPGRWVFGVSEWGQLIIYTPSSGVNTWFRGRGGGEGVSM